MVPWILKIPSLMKQRISARFQSGKGIVLGDSDRYTDRYDLWGRDWRKTLYHRLCRRNSADPYRSYFWKDALKSIDLKTIFLFGGTLSLAKALEVTGAGEMIADKVIGALGANPSPVLFTFVVFILCCIMTNFMSNTATTALMAPICVSIAQGMGADPRAVLMACVIGGSCAYATPIGMPANTMVLGAGNYKFIDYVKAGMPLIAIATVVSMIILPIAFPFYP